MFRESVKPSHLVLRPVFLAGSQIKLLECFLTLLQVLNFLEGQPLARSVVHARIVVLGVGTPPDPLRKGVEVRLHELARLLVGRSLVVHVKDLLAWLIVFLLDDFADENPHCQVGQGAEDRLRLVQRLLEKAIFCHDIRFEDFVKVALVEHGNLGLYLCEEPRLQRVEGPRIFLHVI